MAVDYGRLQAALDKIDWGEGLTRDGIRLRYKGLPEDIYMHLPSEKEFRSGDELIMFARQRLEVASRPEPFNENEIVEEGGPMAWGDSPTAITEPLPDAGHGVGSGADPGYTGGGSAQTGVGREGTTYGDGLDEVGDVDER
jgi:hypothetical protein